MDGPPGFCVVHRSQRSGHDTCDARARSGSRKRSKLLNRRRGRNPIVDQVNAEEHMKKARFGFAIGVLLVVMVAGCAAPAATPAPIPTATPAPTVAAVPPTAQVIAAGFTPESVCTIPNVVGLDQSMAQGLLAKLRVAAGPRQSVRCRHRRRRSDLSKTRRRRAHGALQGGCGNRREPRPDTYIDPSPCNRYAIANGHTCGHRAPAETPTRLPSPTPSNRIFYDNFADGVKPEWNFSGGDVRTVNDELVIKGAAETA